MCRSAYSRTANATGPNIAPQAAHRRGLGAPNATANTAKTAAGATTIGQRTSICLSLNVATLPGNVNVENQRVPNGDVYVWLDHATVAKLKALRAPGESFSDVILRVAARGG
jgi:hypothetical protein